MRKHGPNCEIYHHKDQETTTKYVEFDLVAMSGESIIVIVAIVLGNRLD